MTSVWQRVLGVENATVERVELTDPNAEEADLHLVAQVRLHKGERHRCGRHRCGRCRARCPR